MKHFKSKNNYSKSILKIVIFMTFILIIIFTSFLLINFNKKINTNISKLVKTELNRLTTSIITEKINNNILNKESLSNMLIINKDKNNEILYVDFNLDNAYKVLDKVSETLINSYKDIRNGNIDIDYYDNKLSKETKGVVLNIPMGSLLNGLYFYNLGSKIPVKINFIESILTNLETKITSYGINNALAQIYIYIDIKCEIISPFKIDSVNLKYNTLIASLMIEGNIPNFYNGELSKTSSIYEKKVP